MTSLRNYLNCALILAVGWFAGSAFTTIYFLQSGQGGYALPSVIPQSWIPVSLTSMLHKNTRVSMARVYINNSGVMSTRHLPSLSLRGNDNSIDDESLILLVWLVDDNFLPTKLHCSRKCFG